MNRNVFFAQIYRLVRLVPAGRVVTYGQIARVLHEPHAARTVGWAMHLCPDDVPWWRVVGAGGRILTDALPLHGGGRQQALLQTEGIAFDPKGDVVMAAHSLNDDELNHLAQGVLEP